MNGTLLPALIAFGDMYDLMQWSELDRTSRRMEDPKKSWETFAPGQPKFRTAPFDVTMCAFLARSWTPRHGRMINTAAAVTSRESNSLLATMLDTEWERIQPHCQSVELGAGQTLYDRHETIDFVYFVRRGCVSLVIEFVDGFQAEAGMVGSEGMVGVPLIYRIKTDIVSAVAQAPSEAVRLSAVSLLRELEHMPDFKTRLLRYGEGMRAQAMQLAACNGHHGLDARLARCILTLEDRYRSSALPVTHELLAGLLCAHRPSISVAAKRLQQAGLIRYAAGQLMVVDRAGLERATCECYRAIRDHLDHVVSHR